MRAEFTDLGFNPSTLSASDIDTLDEGLQGTLFRAHAAVDGPHVDANGENIRRIASSARFIAALVFIEDSTKVVTDARTSIQGACDDPALLRQVSAQLVQAKCGSSGPTLAVDLLVRQLHQRLRLLAQSLDLSRWATRRDALDPVRTGASDETFWLDRAVAKLLQDIGPTGEKFSIKMLNDARKSWGDYCASPTGIDRLRTEQGLWKIWLPRKRESADIDAAHPVVKVIAQVLLRDVVLPQLKERAKASEPAVNLKVSRDVSNTLWRPGLGLRREGEGVALVDGSGVVVGSVPVLPVDELALVERGFTALGRLTGHRLFRWLVQEGHYRAFTSEPSPSVIVVEGGLTQLAANIGAKGTESPGELRAILRAGHEFRRHWPGGEAGGLWTYLLDEQTGPGRTSVIEIHLGPMLMPYYGKRQLPKDQQLLVPLVPIPPLVSRPRDHAAQAAYQLELVMALVDRCRQVYELGGGDIPDTVLRGLAEQVGLPEATRSRVMDRWMEEGDDGPAFLERVGQGIYNLADNEVFGRARRFLYNTGKVSIEQGERARQQGRRRRSPHRG